MKKIFPTILLLLGSLCAFTACEDDRDDNPTLIQPNSFLMNVPEKAEQGVDLKNTDSISLSWNRPVYTSNGSAVVTSFEVQVSATGSFTTSLAEAEADENGSKVADYATLGEATTQCATKIKTEELNKTLLKLLKWDAQNIPAAYELNLRIAASAGGHNPVVSNVVKLKVMPYYIALEKAPVEMWYLIGGCIGDGKWNNALNAVGTSIYPLSVVDGYEYDEKTGKGMLTFTGYFTTDGFKLIQTPGSWDNQWGTSDGALTGVKNDGNSKNFIVPSNGYYTLTLDTRNDQINIEAADLAATVYPTMLIAGDFNGWNTETAMKPVNTTASMTGHNHVWTYTIDATAGPTTAKFLQPGWAPNWGGSAFPAGYGKDGGDNIPVAQGKWVVTFNDLDGSYCFTAQ